MPVMVLGEEFSGKQTCPGWEIASQLGLKTKGQPLCSCSLPHKRLCQHFALPCKMEGVCSSDTPGSLLLLQVNWAL